MLPDLIIFLRVFFLEYNGTSILEINFVSDLKVPIDIIY